MVGSAGPSGSSVTVRLADSNSYQRCGLNPVTDRRIRPLSMPLMLALSFRLLADDAFGRCLDLEGGRDQRSRIVALRAAENLFRRTILDDLAVAHDDDVIGKRPHD